MRIAVISDIHANLIALQTVLAAIDARKPDAIWCLGDIVGYGPHPQACIETIRQRAALCLAGNHDLAVTGNLALADFNPVARAAVLWQRQQISDESLAWLAQLAPKAEAEGVTLAHGSPRHPAWEYVNDATTAEANYHAFSTQLCLIGHSHVAGAWRLQERGGKIKARAVAGSPETPLTLSPEAKWLLNPGSVGQPRDHDPRAAFALLDTESKQWNWHRVDYDIDAVAAAIMAAGLPEILARRLYLGW